MELAIGGEGMFGNTRLKLGDVDSNAPNRHSLPPIKTYIPYNPRALPAMNKLGYCPSAATGKQVPRALNSTQPLSLYDILSRFNMTAKYFLLVI